MAVYLAYDGSSSGNWTAQYAIRMAMHHPGQSLHAICVDGPSSDARTGEEGDGHLEHLREQCARLQVALRVIHTDCSTTVDQAIRSVVPAGQDSLLICGTRVRGGRTGILSGTVSERLLRSQHCRCLAVRVVHPGLLGLPRRLLIPLAGHPRKLGEALSYLELLAPDLDHLDLLLIRRVSRRTFRRLNSFEVERLASRGHEYLRAAEQQLEQLARRVPLSVHSHVIVSDDVPKEIAIAANRLRSRLILMGASQRNLRQRFLYGNPLEQVLRDAPCDVAVYSGPTVP